MRVPAHEVLVKAVGTALGSEWTAFDRSGTPEEWDSWSLVHADGRTLGFEWASYPKERIVIHGLWPRAEDGQIRRPRAETTTSITVAPTKSGAQIAHDIARRLLPFYSTSYTEARQLVEDANSYRDETRENVQRLLRAATGATLSHNRESVFFGSNSHAYSAQVSGGSVRFEAFSLPIEAALKLLPHLQKEKADR